MQMLCSFVIFPVHGENGLGWPHMGPGRFFFPANPDIADILSDMDFDFDNVHLLDVLGF